MRLEELRECDLVLWDHPAEMPWFAKAESRYLSGDLRTGQVPLILYLQAVVSSLRSVSTAVIDYMTPTVRCL